jgi:hypothetical protein
MKLMTKAIERKLPPLGSTENVPMAEKMAVVKFFFPSGRATWYATEGSRTPEGDIEFFGYVVSPLGPDCDEWGYFRLNELGAVFARGLKVERDLFFTPTKISEFTHN